MTDFTSRVYSDPQDVQRMIDVLRAVRPGKCMADYPGIADLQELMGIADIRAKTRLWFDGQERPVAFAFINPPNNLAYEYDGREKNASIVDEIMVWGEQCTDEIALDTCCREEDAERKAHLLGQGFVEQPGSTWHMVRPLSELIPDPVFLAGFRIRAVSGVDEAEALAELHRAAFGTPGMTTESRLAMMRVPEYDPAGDLVVIAPDGSLAAYLMCWISEAENHITGRKDGHTDPVATCPAYQRLGLARALLLTGLRLLKARGMDTARLGTSSTNIAMQRVARSVGFRVDYISAWYRRSIAR